MISLTDENAVYGAVICWTQSAFWKLLNGIFSHSLWETPQPKPVLSEEHTPALGVETPAVFLALGVLTPEIISLVSETWIKTYWLKTIVDILKLIFQLCSKVSNTNF